MIGDGPQRALTPGAAYIVIISREVKKNSANELDVLLNWWLLYLTRPRNNVYIAILYLYKSYF